MVHGVGDYVHTYVEFLALHAHPIKWDGCCSGHACMSLKVSQSYSHAVSVGIVNIIRHFEHNMEVM